MNAKVTRLIAAAGSQFAVFGEPGDALWLPAEVQPDALAEWARHMNVVSGSLERLPPATAVLAWAETESVAALRQRGDVGASTGMGGGWREDVWLRRAAPGIVSAVNHRRFAFDVSAARGDRLPGARFIATIEELERHLGNGGAAAGDGAWVVKALHAAAGRERVRRCGGTFDAETRVRIQRLLARYGELLFEPWVARVADFGCCGVVLGDGRTIVFAPHQLECDAGGVFRAITIDDGGTSIDAGGHLNQVREAAILCADALATAGYRGPFGVDSYLFRDVRSGALRLRPIGEINGRFTFGHVARAICERTSGSGEPFRFRLP